MGKVLKKKIGKKMKGVRRKRKKKGKKKERIEVKIFSCNDVQQGRGKKIKREREGRD